MSAPHNDLQKLFHGGGELVPAGLRGYRTWRGLSPEGRLRSTGVTHEWAPACFRAEQSTGYEHARCLMTLTPADEHAAPGRHCSCGLYGWYSPNDSRIVPGTVFGAVEATGRTVLGAHGFRAQTATVLGVTADDEDLRHDLEVLGYPVHATVDELVTALPPDDVSSLVDHACGPRCQINNPWIALTGGPAGALHYVTVSTTAFDTAMKAVAAVCNAAGTSAAKAQEHALAALQALAAAADGDEHDDAPTDDSRRGLRARALALRRARNTGPRLNPFARRGDQ